MNALLLLGQVAPEAGEATVGWWTRLESFLDHADVRVLLASLFTAVGLSLLMPGSRRSGRGIGAISFIAGGLLVVTLLPSLGIDLLAFVFWVLSGITIFSGIGTVTSRSPVYCAIWFALTLLGVGGLMLIGGAQFLGIATVAVYAGAIVVTFLFVLMLAQPEGHAFYDRVSWGSFPRLFGCVAGMAMTGVLLWTMNGTEPTTQVGDENPVLVVDHVAHLGGQLFTTHLLAVEVGGVLLLAALVGAVAIAAYGNSNQDRLKRQLEAAVDPASGSSGTVSRGDVR